MIKPVHRNMFPLFLQSLGHAGTAVEVGVAEGNYSRTFLDLWPGPYVMVDRWCHIEGYDDVMNGPDAEHELRFEQALGVANQHEGIGMGATPEAARRNCCLFGKRQIVEEGVAYSPARRQWFAVIRYR